MKILAIGDFHGKFPGWIPQLIRKEKIDLVVSIGDYGPFLYRKLWFETCYGQNVDFWDVIGKKKYKEVQLKEMRAVEGVFKKLDKLGIQVITVLGNFDQAKQGGKNDVFDVKKSGWKWAWKDLFTPVLNKYRNIKRFDYKAIKFGNYVFIGMNGHSFPGKIKSKAYKKSRAKLEKLFRKNRKEKIIFVSHNIAYNTKLDKVTAEDAHEKAKGKHVGSKLAKRIINKWNPVLHLGGHVHEGMGKDKIKKTLAVNVGSAHDGEATVIDLEKMRIKFIK
ncbi:hypothetical protein GW923_03280 [Candidatus Pacearchaeota archaeon]|nr:hypothetical protein [Candidatus Pacearchaeota archaeon]OIO42754.1 MAG: hypothetical protein AUJ63_01925 [Candidatus Pacearchaeota archaeon CG1_02_35_32]